MAFGDSQRKREFFSFLQQNGLVPPSPAPIPIDIARGHNLPTTDPAIISQMYGDTRTQPAPSTQDAVNLLLNAPLPSSPAQPGNYTPQDRSLDMFLNSPAGQYAGGKYNDPSKRESVVQQFILDGLTRQQNAAPPPPPKPTPVGPDRYAQMSATDPITVGSPVYVNSIDQWLALSPEERAVTPPVDPQGVPYPNWTSLTPDQQAMIAEQLAAGPAKDLLGLDKASNAIVHAAAPVVGPVVDKVVDVAKPVVEPVVNAMGVPEEWWYDKQMDAARYMANNNGEMPTWAVVAYSDLPYQDKIPKWAPFNSQAADIWFLPTWLQDHPEDLETIRNLEAQAKAEGRDPNDVINEWWSQKQGLLISMGSRGINDPLNATLVLGAAGKMLAATTLRNEANTGVKGGRVVEAISKGLQAPDDIVNAPWKIAQPVASSVARRIVTAADGTPLQTIAQFFSSPSTMQKYRNAAADVAQAETTSLDAIIRDSTPPLDTSMPISRITDPDNPYRVIPASEPNPATVTGSNIDNPNVGFTPPDAETQAIRREMLAQVPDDELARTVDRLTIENQQLPPDPVRTDRLTVYSAELDRRQRIAGVTSPTVSPNADEFMRNYSQDGITRYETNLAESRARITPPLDDADIARFVDEHIRVVKGTGNSSVNRGEVPVHYAGNESDAIKYANNYRKREIERIMGMSPEERSVYVRDKYILSNDDALQRMRDRHAEKYGDAPSVDNTVDNAAPIADNIETPPTATGDEIAQYQPRTDLPKRDPVLDKETGQEVDFSLNPKPGGVRTVDVLAREQPTVWTAAREQVLPYYRDQYQPNYNMLTTDKLDEADELKRLEIPGAEPYMEKPARGTTKAYTRYQGSNAALSQVVQAEAFGNLRLAVYQNGGDVTNLRWEIAKNLRNNAVDDPALAKLLGVPLDKTRKGMTKESVVAHYYAATDPEIEAGIVKHLEDKGFFRTTPGIGEEEQRAYERYIRAKTIKEDLVNATPEQMDKMLAEAGITRAPEVPKEPAPIPTAPVTRTQAEADLIKEEHDTFTRVLERMPETDGDIVIAKQLHNGDISEANAKIAATRVGDTNKTVMDLTLENLLEHDLKTAGRITASQVAEARRLRGSVVEGILEGQGITRPEINRFLRWNSQYLGMVKEGLILNPFRAGSAGIQDAIGNALFQTMRGHPNAAFHTLNPMNHLAWMKHTMRGKEIETVPFKLARDLELKMPNSIVEIQTRDLLDPLDETAWGKFGEKIGGVFGDAGAKVGAGVTRPISSKTARAFRHGIDQNARSVLWGDDILANLDTSRSRFLLEMRNELPAQKVNMIAKELPNSGVFSPSDVRTAIVKHDAGNANKYARIWREELDRLSREAQKEVERVHFTYKMSKADEVARHTVLFHYWLSRASLYYPKTVLGNPYLLNLNYKMWKQLDAEAERQGVGNPMNLFFKFMAGDGGVQALVDPIGMILPYTMFRDVATSYGNESAYDQWTRRFGLFVNPMIAAAAVIAGQSSKFPDLSGTLGSRQSVIRIADWLRNHGYDLGTGAGITEDYIAHIQNGVIDLINDAASWVTRGKIGDVPAPDPEQARTTQAVNIMIAQAEAEYGMSYKDMHKPGNEKIMDEVTAAQVAITSGNVDGNKRAEDAVREMSNQGAISAVVRATVPGNVQIQNESVETYKGNLDSGFDTGFDTPAEQSALLQNQAVTAGSPEALVLGTENEQLKNVGTEREKTLYQGYNDIAYNKALDPMGYVVIAGRVYRGYEMNAMTDDQRLKLAQAWLLDNDSSPQWLEGYKTRRDTVVAGSDQLPEYKQYQSDARKYEGGATYTYDPRTKDPIYQGGGVRAMREDLERIDPNFGAQIQKERERLQSRGVSGEELETSLDIWASGPEGYNAYRGTKIDIKDEAPLPTMDPTKVLPNISQPSATTGSTASTGGTSTSGSTPDKMPKWQVELVNEKTRYEAAVASFEAEHGPIEGYGLQSDMVNQLVGQPSADLMRYYEWAAEQQAQGLGYSMETYLAFKNAESEAKKKTDKAAADQAAATLGDVPVEDKTVQQLLDEVDSGK